MLVQIIFPKGITSWLADWICLPFPQPVICYCNILMGLQIKISLFLIPLQILVTKSVQAQSSFKQKELLKEEASIKYVSYAGKTDVRTSTNGKLQILGSSTQNLNFTWLACRLKKMRLINYTIQKKLFCFCCFSGAWILFWDFKFSVWQRSCAVGWLNILELLWKSGLRQEKNT